MAQAEFDQLLSFCIEYAKRRLDKQDAFYPFGASMRYDGSASADGVPRQGDGQPTTQSIIDAYMALYQQRAQAGDLKAAAICWDGVVTLGDGAKIDVIAMVLEHKSRESYFAYLPYAKNEQGVYEYGELGSEPRDPQFF